MVSLVYPRSLTALSNAAIESVGFLGDADTVTFATSPLMSTYLLAVCVGSIAPASTVSGTETERNFFPWGFYSRKTAMKKT